MDLKNRYYKVLDSLPDHVFVFSESGIYIDVYGGEDNNLGFDCKPFIGLSLYDVAPESLALKFHSHIKTALATNETQIIQYKLDNDENITLPESATVPDEVWFEGVIKPLSLIENGERTVVWMAKNITHRHQLESKLKQLSEMDDLTGIANRRAFTSVLSETLDQYHLSGEGFAVMMLDIDRFKRVNDSLGHAIGDQAIVHMVNVLNAQLRANDVFGRIGGEEFAIILNGVDISSAAKTAEIVREKLENSPLVLSQHKIELTISIGVTEVNGSDENINSLLTRADKSMYQSKKLGRNRVTLYCDDLQAGDKDNQCLSCQMD